MKPYKMDKERLEILSKGIQKESWPRVEHTGGQTTGQMPKGVRVWHEDLKFDMKIDAGRSQLKQLQFISTVFELFLEEFYP